MLTVGNEKYQLRKFDGRLKWHRQGHFVKDWNLCPVDESDLLDRLAKAEGVLHKIESQSGRLFEVGLCRQYFDEVNR